MKYLLIKIITSLSLSLIISGAMANDRYINYEGQGVWASNSGEPIVKVTLKGSSVYAKLTGQGLPEIRLKTINSELLNEYTEQFIRMQDFTRDGYTDIAVLKSVGVGGANRCYSVFEYLPDFYSYRSRSTKTICLD